MILEVYFIQIVIHHSDTQSLACFYTGLYPKFNGCKTRIEWPKYYQNLERFTIFEL